MFAKRGNKEQLLSLSILQTGLAKPEKIWSSPVLPHLVSVLCFRLLLLNQFHDVLPGSCIQLVVEDALQGYAGGPRVWLGGHLSVGALWVLPGGAAEVSILDCWALWVQPVRAHVCNSADATGNFQGSQRMKKTSQVIDLES